MNLTKDSRDVQTPSKPDIFEHLETLNNRINNLDELLTLKTKENQTLQYFIMGFIPINTLAIVALFI